MIDVPVSTELFQHPSHPHPQPRHKVLPNHVWLPDDPLIPSQRVPRPPPAKP